MTFSLETTRLRINAAFIYACTKNWIWDTTNPGGRLNDFDLWSVIEGDGLLKSEGKTYHLMPGDCFLLRPGKKYFATHNQQKPLVLYPVHFDFVDGHNRPFTPADELLPAFYRRIANIMFFRAMLERIQLNMERDRRNVSAEWLKIILIELDSWNLPENAGVARIRQQGKLDSLCQDVMIYPNKYQNVNEMSAQMNLSPSYFSRLFKKSHGISANDFLINSRIETAKKLLVKTNDNISEIAERLGYSSVFFFSRQFKEKTGKAPREYRQQ